MAIPFGADNLGSQPRAEVEDCNSGLQAPNGIASLVNPLPRSLSNWRGKLTLIGVEVIFIGEVLRFGFPSNLRSLGSLSRRLAEELEGVR